MASFRVAAAPFASRVSVTPARKRVHAATGLAGEYDVEDGAIVTVRPSSGQRVSPGDADSAWQGGLASSARR